MTSGFLTRWTWVNGEVAHSVTFSLFRAPSSLTAQSSITFLLLQKCDFLFFYKQRPEKIYLLRYPCYYRFILYQISSHCATSLLCYCSRSRLIGLRTQINTMAFARGDRLLLLTRLLIVAIFVFANNAQAKSFMKGKPIQARFLPSVSNLSSRSEMDRSPESER